MRLGSREFDLEHHVYVMGILNVTPDSFSDGGRFDRPEEALRQVERMVREGADLIDVGGESTRPGHVQISDQEEIDRVAPVIERIRREFDVPVSVDTYKSGVAKAALEAGAHMVNDIWGLKYDPNMAGVIASHDAACCLMHNRTQAEYQDLIPDMLTDLQESIDLARQAGIGDDKIILDPGVCFAKSYENNLEAIARVSELRSLGFPVLLATSRKSFIGNTLNLPVDQRLEGTLATTVLAVLEGCCFVRVHDVLENKRIIAMTEAIRAHQRKESENGAGGQA